MILTLWLLILAFAYVLLRLNAALRAMDITRYRQPMHRASLRRPAVSDDWTPLPHWVRVQLAPTVHSRPAVGSS